MLENGKPELLVPASSLEVLKVAVMYGADAVYIGGELYGLRAKAKNFSMEDMKEGIEFAHKYGKRVFVTANITAHNADLKGVKEYFEELRQIKPDALIISDPGVFQIAKDTCPEIEIHISTQSNNVNYATYQFWKKQGAKRVVSARELSIREIKEIRENIPDDLEIETFVHGAMCISYSGRCLLSNYFTGRDANRGACTHPCRWKYYIAHLTARSITYDTASVHKWIIKDYMIREMDGMKENIVKGDRIDSTLFMEPADFLIMKNQQEMMTSPQLSEYISRQRQRGFANIKEFEIEYHKRIAMSFASFILTLIGVSLSSKKTKGGMGLHLGIGLALSFSYILFQTIASTFAVNGNVPPVIAVWIPNILYAFIAFYLYQKAPK